MGDILVIGIAGGSGSGKTTLTRRLAERLGENVTVINHDSYYCAHHELTYEQRTQLNYDHPDSYDTHLLVQDLARLKAGLAIDVPVYSFEDYDRTDETVSVAPTKVIIVEGILIFTSAELRELLDIKVFVDTDADVRVLRRAKRDVRKRGRTLESVITQYLATVKPMHEQFVEPSKKFADIIVPEGGKNEVALEMLAQRVEAHLAQLARRVEE